MDSMRVSHRHLRKFIEDSPKRGIDLLDDPIFYMELCYSSLIVATFPVEDRRAFLLFDEDTVAVFTDIHEYDKVYGAKEGLTPMAYDFDCIISANADLVLNPASENVFINSDYFQYKEATPYFQYDSPYIGFNCAELELVARNMKNTKLKSFISDPSRIYDYGPFFCLLKKSLLLTVVHPNATGNVADLTDSIAPIIVGDEGYIELFTDIGQIERAPDTYVQVVNLAQFFEMIIRFDFEGAVLNPDTDDVRIDREMILLNFEKFRKNYDPSKYMQAHNYAFRLQKE